MIETVQRSYVIRRGDAWEGEAFRLIASSGASYWTNPVVKSQIRKTTESPVVFEFTMTPIVTTEGTNGVLTFSISMTAAQTALLTPGSYIGDIEVTAAQQQKRTFIDFEIEVIADITR